MKLRPVSSPRGCWLSLVNDSDPTTYTERDSMLHSPTMMVSRSPCTATSSPAHHDTLCDGPHCRGTGKGQDA